MTDNSVWITKTHYPQDQQAQKFSADKIIYITRHPIDVLPSIASLVYTWSHTLEPKMPWNNFKVWPQLVEFLLPYYA